jgi:hypothetical protein
MLGSHFHLVAYEATMPIKRISLSEVRVDELIYTFIDSAEADGFLTCLLTENLAECELRYPALSERPFRTDPDDFKPGA